MSHDDILKIIAKSEKNLMFKVTNPTKFIENYYTYSSHLDKIKTFDFTNYQNYLTFECDEIYLPFSRLRDDEIDSDDSNSPNELFANAVDFKEGMVILKNEK